MGINKTLFDYPEPKAVDLSECEMIGENYMECLILENGKIVELKGSHIVTIANYYNIDLESIPISEYGNEYFVKKYNVVFVHSRINIEAPKVLSIQQRQTIKRLFNRGWLGYEKEEKQNEKN